MPDKFDTTLTLFSNSYRHTCSSRVAEIAQLGERQTEDLKVPGSNPESSHEL